ncbi:Phosphatase PAP2 family protein [Sporosarcina sp. ANT_H38]|uniref:phosphatase PAP2 family protein n=1 Tax=Sporosarcina sp. ANT_H38 TaxID=2597358 RepID=UPI001CAA89AD|nr:phosphatase PAP2 family protein [Sporosarcina sp. ANT_H38]
MHERKRQLLLAFILCIGFGLTFVYIATAVSNNSIGRFDTAIIGFIQGLEAPWLTAIMKGFTWVGSGLAVTTITVIGFIVLYFFLRYRQQSFLLTIVVVGSILFNKMLKSYFKRERPELHRIMDAGGFSFPSGHSMMAFALYAILAYIAWRNVKTTTNHVLLFLFAAFMIIMIGTSRIYLGVHYPSDIIGGYIASALWVTLAISVYSYFQNKRET